MARAVSEFQSLLSGLAADLIERAEKLAAAVARLDRAEALAFITEAFPELVTPYLAASADVTATWYDAQDPAAGFIAEPAELAPVDELGASGRIALLEDDPVAAVARSAEKHLFQTSRRTVRKNAKREGVRWARHASANACGFCRILAIRGPAYSSEKAATRGHDNCHCIAVPVRGGAYEPAPYVEQWKRDYKQAIKDGARTPGEIANAMDYMPGGRRYKGDDAVPTPDPAGPKDPNGPGGGSRTGFGDPAEFPPLPDGSRVPFTPADVPALEDGDYAHFAGTDGSGQGGHIAGFGREGKSEFPQWVQSLEDLQRVQDAVLANPARVQRGEFGRYEVRGLVDEGGTQMVVHVVLELDGTPAAIYPINGDFVVSNTRGKPIPQPLDRDALLGW